MRQLLSILAFYKPFVIWSFVINIAITFVYPFVFIAILTKLLLTVFVWYIANETNVKHKLMLYRALGVSTFKLFSVLFLVDTIITITFMIVIKEFL
ncbi:hypothetical protein JYT89_01140 [Flavobacteriaceae bacterium AH-315-B10]|nr:hypothetical protein [Flavobacteriaceae bacterium AH-315-B10]